MEHPFSWLKQLQDRFKIGSNTAYKKYSDNPTVILDDTVNLLSSIKNNSSDRIKNFVSEFNAALPVVEKAGFSLRMVEIRLGIPPKLTPHFDQVRELSIREKSELMETLQDKRFTRLLLSTLFKSTELQNSLQIGDLPQGVIQIELTAVPNIILVYGNY